MADIDHYTALQVHVDATQEVIQAAYRRLAQRYHPDVNRDPDAAVRMRAINAAYDILGRPAERVLYDRRRSLNGESRRGETPAIHVGTWAVPPAKPMASPERLFDTLIRKVALLGLVGIAAFAVLMTVLTRDFGRSPTTGDPTLPHGVVVLTPAARALATRVAEAVPPPKPVRVELRRHVELLQFPSKVLVPPDDLQPMAGLPLGDVTISLTCPISPCMQRYSIHFGSWSSGGVRLSAATGRGEFDASSPPPGTCTGESHYCTRPVPGRSGNELGSEYFSGLQIAADSPAVVSHLVCCAGPYWAVSWYDRPASVSYRLELSQAVAQAYGTEIAFDNLVAAQRLVILAATLVQLG